MLWGSRGRPKYSYLATICDSQEIMISKPYQKLNQETPFQYTETIQPVKLEQESPNSDSKLSWEGLHLSCCYRPVRMRGLFIWGVSTVWGHPESGCVLYAWVVYTCREKGYLRLQTAPKKGGRVEG
jgi:hypothetical protein